MRLRDKSMTTTTTTSPREQRASGAQSSLVYQGPPSRPAQVGHFLLHWVEMSLAMCLGGSILNLLVFWAAARIGYPDLRQQWPELSLLVIAFNLSLPMVVWMRFRGMQWRPLLEMAGETIGLAILLIGLAWAGHPPQEQPAPVAAQLLRRGVRDHVYPDAVPPRSLHGANGPPCTGGLRPSRIPRSVSEWRSAEHQEHDVP